MSKIIDGKKISMEVKNELKNEISSLENKPTLVVISVGDDPASKVYVKQKEKCAKYVGINYLHLNYDKIEEDVLINKIEELNNDQNVNGIIVQLPLPGYLDSTKIVNSISPDKDVDGLTYINAGRLLNNEKCLVSCTPKGIMHLLNYAGVDLVGKNVVVIGRSILVGKPMMNLLINANATVTMCHSKTKDIEKITKKADVLIVAIGKKHFVNKDMVKRNAVIIDVGINRIDDKLYGDVDYDNVYEKVKKITPVPGGVGPMTVVMLMSNVLEAYKNQNGFSAFFIIC